MLALVTGATSGIGRATALALASEKFDLVITGRRADRLDALKAEIEQKYGVAVITSVFDVRCREQVESAIEEIAKKCEKIDVLVNNAGLAVGLNPIQEGEIEDWERMIDTNIKGLLYVSRAVAPMMVKQGEGHIVNLCSIAGKEVYANGNVYCASKHAVDAISKAMRVDMLQYGIKVTNICPGAVETEFSIVRFKGDEQRAANTYKGLTPLTGEDIAEVIRYAVMLPKHVCLNDITIMPIAQANSTSFYRK